MYWRFFQENLNGGRTGDSYMKMGDVVRFKDKYYCVGLCKTRTSIELLELKNPLIGLWVSRNEVCEIDPEDQCHQQNTLV